MGRLQQIRYIFEHRAVVLMYHRIASLDVDPWQLAVSPANFEEQLDVLRKKKLVIPVNELADSISGSLPRNTVSLTFDDGYIDNLQAAKPLLEKYDCPASFFIATGYVGQQHEFWWDELERILLKTPVLPASFSMLIDDEPYTYDLGSDFELTPELVKKHESWIWPETPPTRRCDMYLSVWERLKPLPDQHLKVSMHTIRSWAQNSQDQKDQWPMSEAELRELASHALFEIGIHTVSHPALSFHDYEVQHREISASRRFLQERFGDSVSTIAYPYGNYNETTIRVVKDLQLTAGFTTHDRLIMKKADPYRLGRFQVKNWNGDEFEKQLRRWFWKA
jgi:peptidoglycan/xylan/chitin deacetylase (PgdA/CDA1 family)